MEYLRKNAPSPAQHMPAAVWVGVRELYYPTMLVELGESQSEVTIICKTGVEEKVISKVLGMPVSCKKGRIRIYKSQLGVVRKALRTTTQYIFTAKVLA